MKQREPLLGDVQLDLAEAIAPAPALQDVGAELTRELTGLTIEPDLGGAAVSADVVESGIAQVNHDRHVAVGPGLSGKPAQLIGVDFCRLGRASQDAAKGSYGN